MELVSNSNTHRQPMRFDISQIIVSITFVIMWYSNFLTYDFITPIFQFFHGLFIAVGDSTIVDYMKPRTENVTNEVRRLLHESTIDKILDLLVKLVSWLGGVVVIVFTPTLQSYGQQLKTYLTKKRHGYTKRKK